MDHGAIDARHPDLFGLSRHIIAVEQRRTDAAGHAKAVELATLAWYLRERDSRRAAAMATEAEGLSASGEPGPEAARAVARSMLARGCAQALMGELGEGLALVTRAEQVFSETGDPLGVGDAMFSAAELQRTMGNKAAMLAAYEAAAHAYGAVSDPIRCLALKLQQARVASPEGIPADERERLEPVLREAAAVPHPGVQALAEAFLASENFSRQEAKSLAHYRSTRWLARRSGQIRLAIAATLTVSACHSNLHDSAQALAWAEKAVQHARRAGWPLSTANALLDVSLNLSILGRTDAANEVMAEAMGMLASFPHSRERLKGLSYLTQLLIRQQRWNEALEVVSELERIQRASGDLDHRTVQKKADLLSRLNRAHEAQAAIEECLQVYRQTQPEGADPHVMRVYADIARRHGLPAPEGATAPSAPIHYLEAAAASERARGSADDPELLAQLSHDYEAAGDSSRALDCARKAFAALDALRSRQATELSASYQVRYATEKAKAQSLQHRVLAEAEGRRADAAAASSRAKSMFLANMSHELRSPLNAILGFTRLMLSEEHPGSRRHEELGIVMRSGEHLYNLINQVLDMSKIEAGRMELVETAFDLHALLEDVQRMFATAAQDKSLLLQMDVASDVPQHVKTDETKLKQSLINLLGNALKFTAAGQVALSVRRVASHDSVQFEISDTGAGIDAGELAQLGQPFVQSRAGQGSADGTGLGLAISHGFAELMGGQLQLASTPGVGTTATLTIPVGAVQDMAPTLHRPGRRVRRLAPGTAAPRILVVDDLADGRLLLVRTLAPLGFEVREAADGEQALQQWRQWSPHLILMDMRMPVMDGREATRRIRSAAAGHHTIVVALTASSFEEQREEILAAGCDDFLRKPFREDALLEAIARHLALRYEYDDAEAAPPEMDGARLAAMPETLRANLSAAVEKLDVLAVERALEHLRADDPALADDLARLARGFQYERMRELLG